MWCRATEAMRRVERRERAPAAAHWEREREREGGLSAIGRAGAILSLGCSRKLSDALGLCLLSGASEEPPLSL